MQVALVKATTDMSAVDLASRDGVQAQTFLTSVQSPTFWEQCHALEASARPVATFSGWLRGCACHGAQTTDQHRVTCPWKGCRAPEIADRVRAFARELAMLREAHTAPQHACIHDAVARMLAVTDMKLAWVHELPFIIWQVDSSAMAAHFLATYYRAEGPQHRVSMRFGAGDLRTDMELWASGGRPSRRLKTELDAYKFCKLDDTWPEATHRDVSRDRRRVTHASQAWLSATLRLRENLLLWESLDAPGRLRFERMWRRWKAIG